MYEVHSINKGNLFKANLCFSFFSHKYKLTIFSKIILISQKVFVLDQFIIGEN